MCEGLAGQATGSGSSTAGALDRTSGHFGVGRGTATGRLSGQRGRYVVCGLGRHESKAGMSDMEWPRGGSSFWWTKDSLTIEREEPRRFKAILLEMAKQDIGLWSVPWCIRRAGDGLLSFVCDG